MSSGIPLTAAEEAQLAQTIEMFEVITQSQPHDYQSLEILREAYFKLGREKDLIETSKRIAKAYVQMGQLSSAILEFESILQRDPSDEETRNALAEVESKATSLGNHAGIIGSEGRTTTFIKKPAARRQVSRKDGDDGREAMYRIFVEAKVMSAAEFDACWSKQDYSSPVTQPILPFVKIAAERNVVSLDKALRLISDKSRVGYLPIDKYDIDIELARGFSAETCRRWCIIPFDRMSKSVLVATTNPYNRVAAAELEEASQQRLLWFLAPPNDIIIGIKKVFR